MNLFLLRELVKISSKKALENDRFLRVHTSGMFMIVFWDRNLCLFILICSPRWFLKRLLEIGMLGFIFSEKEKVSFCCYIQYDNYFLTIIYYTFR